MKKEKNLVESAQDLFNQGEPTINEQSGNKSINIFDFLEENEIDISNLSNKQTNAISKAARKLTITIRRLPQDMVDDLLPTEDREPFGPSDLISFLFEDSRRAKRQADELEDILDDALGTNGELMNFIMDFTFNIFSKLYLK